MHDNTSQILKAKEREIKGMIAHHISQVGEEGRKEI